MCHVVFFTYYNSVEDEKDTAEEIQIQYKYGGGERQTCYLTKLTN